MAAQIEEAQAPARVVLHLRMREGRPLCERIDGDSLSVTGHSASELSQRITGEDAPIHPDDRNLLQRCLSRPPDAPEFHTTLRFLAPDQSVRILHCHCASSPDDASLCLTLRSPRIAPGESLEEMAIDDLVAMLENTDDYIYFKNRDHVLTAASQSMVDVSLVSGHWSGLIGRTDYEIFPRELADLYFGLERQVLSGAVSVARDIQPTQDAKGNRGWVDNRKYPIRNSDGEIIGLFGVARDVTELEQSLEALRASQALNRIANRMTHMGAWYVDLGNQRLFWSEEVYRIFEVPEASPVSVEGAIQYYVEGSRDRIEEAVERCISEGQTYDLTLQIRTEKGNLRWVRSVGESLRHEDGTVLRIHGTIQDITEQMATEEKVRELAHYDQLTRLANRTLLEERLDYALRMAQRRSEPMALMFLDLDHFKQINDAYGHAMGDKLLIETARRLKTLLRDVDTVARMGGDEFIILLPATDAAGASRVAEGVMKTLSEPFYIEDRTLHTSPSMGIVIYPDDGQDADTLMSHADAAMYQVKHSTRNDYRFFTQAIQARIGRNARIANALDSALKNNAFQLHFQPQWSMSDRSLIGAEALLRWQHPELGTVSPAEFIPLAESSGRMLQLGEWVLRQSLRQLRDWLDQGYPAITMAVNVSAVQFQDSRLPERIAALLAEFQLAGDVLHLELTEAVAMIDFDGVEEVAQQLEQLGVRLSIDDFGSGMSSLGRLRQFNVYSLKIDRSFVAGMQDEDGAAQGIISAIIQMARAMGMRTLAEGAESAEQLAFLQQQGCSEVQGYLLGRPVPAEEFPRFFEAADG